MSDNIYDGIILGGGHNGLILQAYAGLAGLKCLCLERRSEVGGGLTTIEDPRQPGFFHNTHAFFQRAITDMPWYRDLALEDRGLVLIEPELNVALLTRDGRSLQWWTDFQKTFDSFAEFDKRDAQALKEWHDKFLPIVEKYLRPENFSPPLNKVKRRELLQKTPEGRLLLQTSELSPLEFVHKYFQNPTIQAGLLFFNGLREVDLRIKGFGHHIPSLLAQPSKAQMSVNGSRALALALQSAVTLSGGTLLTSAEPETMIVESGRVSGVKLRSGEIFKARKFVASSLNPHQTFLDLIPDEDLPRSWRAKTKSFQYNLLAPLYALHLNLDEPPNYKASEADPALKKAFMTILGLDHVDQFSDIVAHHEAGTVPPPVMWGASPTIFDSSQAPAGKHTAFMWEKLPFNLKGDAGNWVSEQDPLGEKRLAFWSDYAPNLRDSVISSFTQSPLEIEQAFPNMKNGDLLIGSFAGNQIGFDRPFTGAGHYRTHLDGLYLCGSSSHPGGNITGLPGYNAAQVILRDLGIEMDWMPEDISQRLSRY